jgi:hypothetical protein
MMMMMIKDTYNWKPMPPGDSPFAVKYYYYYKKLLGFDMSLQVFTAMFVRISLVSHNALLIGKLLRGFRARFLPPYSVRRKMEATSCYKTSVTNLQSHDAIRQETGVQPAAKWKGQHMQLKHPGNEPVICLGSINE